jgi:hypothetical protein
MAKSFEESYSSGRFLSKDLPKTQNLHPLLLMDQHNSNQPHNKSNHKPNIKQTFYENQILKLKSNIEFYLVCTPLTTVFTTLQIFGKSKDISTEFSKQNRLSRLSSNLPELLQRKYMSLINVNFIYK